MKTMRKKPHQPLINSFLTACLIALILITAAVLKWIYPPAQDPVFYWMIGGLEALMALSILFYWRSWRVWVLLALIVSIWMGFSFYVALFGLPCSCMGGSLQLPRGIAFVLNGLMLMGAWGVLSRYPAHPVNFKRLIWFFSLFFIIGFIMSAIYYNYQT